MLIYGIFLDSYLSYSNDAEIISGNVLKVFVGYEGILKKT